MATEMPIPQDYGRFIAPAAQGDNEFASSEFGDVAEVDLFKGAGDWLNSVDCISIELHGDEAKREIPATLIAAGFELSRHGSLTVAVRKQSRDKP